MIKSILKVLVLLSFAISLYGQSDFFNFSGNGARSAAMGYAFTGVADDATAISWNSAGLTQLYSPEATIIGKVGFNSANFKNFEEYEFDGFPNLEYTEYDVEMASSIKLDFASIIFPFEMGNRKVVVGVAFRNQYDFASEQTENFEINFVPFKYKFVGEGGVNTISPTVALEINEMLSVGTSVNILTGSFEADVLSELADNEYDYGVDFSGVSFDIGLFIKPSDMITIGANLNLPHTLTWEGSWPFFDDNDGSFLYVEDDYKLEINIPFFYSIGLGFRATDNLLVAFDFQSRGWSGAEEVQVSPEINDDTVDFSDNDLNSVHVGIEYLLQSGDAVIPLRAGFYTNPLLDNDFNGDQISTSVFSVGLGLVMESIIIDAAFEFGGLDLDYGDGSVWEETNNRLTIGSTIHFGN